MSKLSCTSSKRIVDYISGTLDNGDRQILDVHLKECQVCYGELESYSDLSLGVRDALRSLRDSSEAHLDDAFLKELAEGRVDFSNINHQNNHLLGCEFCWQRLKDFELSHFEQLKAEEDQLLFYPADLFYSHEEPLAAQTETRLSLDFRSLSSVQTLISARQFQLELFCRDNRVFLCLWGDYPDEVKTIEVKSSGVSSRRVEGESMKSCRFFFVGSINDLLHQLVEVCFEFSDSQWCKKVFFGPMSSYKGPR